MSGRATIYALNCQNHRSLYVHQLIQQHLIHSRPTQPIFAITAACMIALFFAILYMGCSLSQEAGWAAPSSAR